MYEKQTNKTIPRSVLYVATQLKRTSAFSVPVVRVQLLRLLIGDVTSRNELCLTNGNRETEIGEQRKNNRVRRVDELFPPR